MPKLVSIIKEQIPLIAPEQTRYRVTTIPTERTIRFYTMRGLVDKPAAREGQLALYGYRHLLQILAVKYLQSHYLPLRKIKSLVDGASNRDLEQLMPEIAPSSWAHRGFTRRDRLVTAEHGPQAAVPMQSESVSAAAAAMTEPAAPTTGGAKSPSGEAAPAATELDAWHRLEIGPGIELHVHVAALATGQRERLRGVLLRELGALRGWFDGGGKD